MIEYLCNYAVLRFLPYKEIGEFINVGVVVHCPEIDLLDFRLSGTVNRRVRQFFPELDRGVYAAAMRSMERQLQRHRNVDELFTNERRLAAVDIGRGLDAFKMLLQRREALLHFAAPGTLLADPRSACAELFQRHVERQFAQEGQYQEVVMQKTLNRWMREWGVRDYYDKDVKVGDEMFHLKLPFARRVNDRVFRGVKPLDLIRPEPTKVFEHGDMWAQRLRRLRERDHLPDEMVFPVQTASQGIIAEAARRVLEDLESLGGVRCVTFNEEDRELRSALDVSEPSSNNASSHASTAIYDALKRAAIQHKTLTYGEVAPLAGLDVASPADRNRIAQILDEISSAEHVAGRPLLSALVISATDGKPGAGFFKMARRLGLQAADVDNIAFYSAEVRRVFETWKSNPHA